MSGWRRALSLPRVLTTAFAIAGVAPTIQAQATGELHGTVRDSAGAPIGGAEVWIVSTLHRARTDSLGYFHLAALPHGAHRLVARRFGFSPDTVSARVPGVPGASVDFVLDANAYLIDGMTVEESARRYRLLSDFYDRKDRGFGYFVTRDQIEARHPANLSDMMRMIPGTRLMPSVGGTSVLRFSRAMLGGARDCPPQMWVDGVKAFQLNIDDIPPHDVEGIEIYPGPAGLPPQFNTRAGTTTCGVVLVWTRVPG